MSDERDSIEPVTFAEKPERALFWYSLKLNSKTSEITSRNRNKK
jgi:hypothetical protein